MSTSIRCRRPETESRSGSDAHDLTAPPSPVPPLRTGPFLYRFEAATDVLPVGIVPEGLRVTIPFEGRVQRGAFRDVLQGARVWGIDHLLLRRDGVGVIDAQKTISFGDTHIFEHLRAYCLPPDGLAIPPLEAMLDPGFEWPDVWFPILGSSTFRASGEWAWLNREVSLSEGVASFAHRRLALETRLLPNRGTVAAPDPVGQPFLPERVTDRPSPDQPDISG